MAKIIGMKEKEIKEFLSNDVVEQIGRAHV